MIIGWCCYGQGDLLAYTVCCCVTYALFVVWRYLQMTYADVVVFSVLDQLRHADSNYESILRKCKPLVKFMQRMAKHPNIAEYVQNPERYALMKKARIVRKASLASLLDSDYDDDHDVTDAAALAGVNYDSDGDHGDEHKRVVVKGAD